MLVAHELIFEELAGYLEILLIESNAHWLRLHFGRIYQEVFPNNKLLNLQKWCDNIVVKYPNKVFESEDFTSTRENAIVSLIEQDDLQMEEVKIWKYIIKLGIAQNPGLSTNPEDWSNENILSLKTTLKNCLPLIRYFQISGEDIYEHIQPYSKILEENLWKDLIKRHMAPNQPVSSVILPPRVILTTELPQRSTKPFSNVITEIHSAEIASWIDKNDNMYSISNNPYEFRLLFRGSRDGFTRESFWNLCNRQKDLVVVIKVKDTDEILGGYNPIGWDKSVEGRQKCEGCFTFSLKNGTAQNSILSRVKNINGPIFSYSIHGLIFYCSLYMYRSNHNNRCFCYNDNSDMHYEKPIRKESTYNGYYSYFLVEEYEIFQIHKKAT
ncbi:hypothetical protein C2G38_2027318 [Gigaspora rosea]|uniref:TLDc domain-containing protein n=1 Tax=Gigaspora rosea TaxID=44941 RepID=A0A397W770_9GLOM|nr:hypothetical protein C2G38_2027318 [Gigaspora rosea]